MQQLRFEYFFSILKKSNTFTKSKVDWKKTKTKTKTKNIQTNKPTNKQTKPLDKQQEKKLDIET